MSCNYRIKCLIYNQKKKGSLFFSFFSVDMIQDVNTFQCLTLFNFYANFNVDCKFFLLQYILS